MKNVSSTIYDPRILDFILSLKPQECLAVDPPIRALLDAPNWEDESVFGSDPSPFVLYMKYRGSRQRARQANIAQRRLPIVLLSEINQAPHTLANIERIYVYTSDEEISATRALHSKLEQAGINHCRVYSLKNEIHPIISTKIHVDRGLARLQDSVPANNLFILSTPRAGSFMLCEYLASLGAGLPDEHLKPAILNCVRERGTNDFDFALWLRTLMKIASTDDGQWFGTKMISHFLIRLLPHLCAVERDEFKAILARSFVLFLRRDDKILQGISNYKARTTHVYRIPNQTRLRAYRHVKQVEYSFDKIQKNVASLEKQEQQLNQIVKEYTTSAHRITYEELCESPLDQIRKVALYLRIPPPSSVSLSQNKKMGDTLSLEMAARYKQELHTRSNQTPNT